MQLKNVEMKSAVDFNDNDQRMWTIAVGHHSKHVNSLFEGISGICKQDRESTYNYKDHYDMLVLISGGSLGVRPPTILT